MCVLCSLLACALFRYQPTPLLFDVWEDPSEAYPLTPSNQTEIQTDIPAVLAAIEAARQQEDASFVQMPVDQPDLLPSEKDGVAICCDRSKQCDCDGKPAGDARPWFATLGY